ALIDEVLGSGVKSGYTFTFTAGANAAGTGTAPAGCAGWGFTAFSVAGIPTTYQQTGQNGYFVDASGVVRYTTDGTAPTAASPAL
ncbi:MAG: hypothetical protein WCD40_17630, partial [Candidatus Acidiferrales bacterium]